MQWLNPHTLTPPPGNLILRAIGALLLAASCMLALLPDTAIAADHSDKLRNSQQFKSLVQKAQSLKKQNRKVRIIVRSALDESQTTHNERINKGLARLKGFAAASGLNAEKEINGLPLMVYEVDENQLNALVASGLIDNVEEDRLLEPHLVQSMSMIKGSIAHNFNLKGSGAAIAVLDTGVQSNHPMLTGRVISEACFSTTSSASSSQSICPAGGTAIRKGAFTIGYKGTGQAVPCNGLAAGVSGCDHGTHVASIAAGAPAGSAGSGVAPEANIIAIQVFSYVNNDTYCGAGKSPCLLNFTSDLYNALYYVQTIASTNNIAAANLSLGGGQFTSICDTDSASGSNTVKTYIDNLRSAGVVTVASSGNSSYTSALSTPACISTTLSVGSVSDTANTVSSWSNSASFLDMLAPGSPIYAAIPGSSYATKSGTSMAAPHVSGAIALLKGYNSSYTPAQMENLILQNGVSVTDSRNSITKPRLDLGKMTQAAAGPAYTPVISITQPLNNALIDRSLGNVTLLANASDPQDGNISSNVTWSSSLNGAVTSPANLSAGTHTLTATINDSSGFTAAAEITVTVVNKPVTTISTPASNINITAGQNLTLSGTASDVESGNLSASIQWTSSISGALGTGATINTVLPLGTHVITASVTDGSGYTPSNPATRTITVSCTDCDNDGMDDSWEALYNLTDPSSDEDGDTLSNLEEFNANSHPRDAAPTANITSPDNNATFGNNTAITFTASANDNEDGNLASAISWHSDKDGVLGTGATLTRSLSVGQHLISIDVTDSQGAHPVSPAAIVVNIGIKGDINGDGAVDVTDLYWLKQYLAGERTFDSSATELADNHPENGDNKIDISDLYWLEKALLQ